MVNRTRSPGLNFVELLTRSAAHFCVPSPTLTGNVGTSPSVSFNGRSRQKVTPSSSAFSIGVSVFVCGGVGLYVGDAAGVTTTPTLCLGPETRLTKLYLRFAFEITSVFFFAAADAPA